MTADSSNLSRNADNWDKNIFFRRENERYARKKVENIIVHGLNCK